jgi:hypothetical protein
MRWALALVAVTAPTVFVSPALAQVPQAIDGVYNVQESDLQGTACEPTPFRAALSLGQTGPNYSYSLLVTKSDDMVRFSPQSGGDALFTATIDQSGAFRGVNGSPFPVEGAFELNARGEMSFRMSWIRSDGAGTCESSILGILSVAAGSTPSAQPSAVLLADLTIGTVQVEAVPFGQTVPVRVNVEAFDAAGARLDPSRYTPVKVELYQDQTLLDTRLTDGQGKVEFRYTPLVTTPNGRSYALVRVVAAKDGFAADEDSETIIVERGLVPLEIIIDAAPRQALPGDRITITGRVVSRTMFGLIASGIPATVSLGNESVTTDSGVFSLTATVPGDSGLSEESSTQHFRLSAEPREVDRHTSGSADVAVEVQNRGRLQLVMSSPQALYHEDENVTVVGRVTSLGQPLSGPATLTLVINGQPQAPAVTAVDGSFTIRFPARDGVPPRAPPDGEGGGELVVTASAPGFLRSLQRSQLFFVRRGAPPCAAGEGYVASVDGRVDFRLKDSEGVQEFSMRPTPGSRLTRGTRVITSGAGRVALRFPVDRQGGTAVVTVHGDNAFLVDDYCLDASDTVRLVLSDVQHRGQLRVDVPSTGPPDARWQVEVKTQAATVRNVRTSYVVTVDDDGTAVAVLGGTVQLDRGASVVELTDGKGAYVPLDPAAQVTTATLTGEADSILGQLIEQAAATPLPPDLLTDRSAGAGGDGSARSLLAAALAGFALVGFATVLVARRRRPATTVSAVGSSSNTHAMTSAVTSFRHTHVVPPSGLAAWTTPNATLPPVAHLDPGLEVVVVESYVTGWARVVCSNGWSGWVDGQRLRSAC